MSLFGDKKEIKSLGVLKGLKAAEITSEQLSAVNAELKELGFEGIEIASAGSLSAISAELKSAKEDNASKDNQLQEKDAKITELNGRIAELGGKAAEEPTPTGAKEDPIKIGAEAKPWETLSNQILEERL